MHFNSKSLLILGLLPKYKPQTYGLIRAEKNRIQMEYQNYLWVFLCKVHEPITKALSRQSSRW
jgi:hypothetical protein